MKGKKHRVSWTDHFCSIIESPIKCMFNSRIIPRVTWSSTHQSYWMPLTCLYVITYILPYICIWLLLVDMFRAIWEFAQSRDCVAHSRNPEIAHYSGYNKNTFLHLSEAYDRYDIYHPSMTEQPAFTVCYSILKHYRSVDRIILWSIANCSSVSCSWKLWTQSKEQGEALLPSLCTLHSL